MAQRDELERLSGALASALGRVAQQGSPSALGAVWTSVAGAATAQAARPVAFEGGVLRVEVETKAWVEALRGQAPQLEARLRAQLPGFRRLQIDLRSTH